MCLQCVPCVCLAVQVEAVNRNPVQAKPVEPVNPEPLPSEPEEEVKDNSVEQEDIKNSLDNMPGRSDVMVTMSSWLHMTANWCILYVCHCQVALVISFAFKRLILFFTLSIKSPILFMVWLTCYSLCSMFQSVRNDYDALQETAECHSECTLVVTSQLFRYPKSVVQVSLPQERINIDII